MPPCDTQKCTCYIVDLNDEGQMKTYVADRDFYVNTAHEVLSVSRGDHIEFDGTRISYRGRTFVYPSFRGAVRARFVTPKPRTAWERLLNDSEDV